MLSQIAELEQLWHRMAVATDRSVFMRCLADLRLIRESLIEATIDSKAIEWLSKIDLLIFQRTCRGGHISQASSRGLFMCLVFWCLPWPIFSGFAVSATLALSGDLNAWALGIVALVSLFIARLGHEIGHLVAGLPVFSVRAVYASRLFVQLRLVLGSSGGDISLRQLIALYLGGPSANLSLAFAGFIVWFLVEAKVMLVPFIAANLALGLGNLLPLRAAATDGYSAFQVYSAYRSRK